MTEKVDNIMEILHKVISVLTVVACIGGLAWSCTTDGDVSAHAVEIDAGQEAGIDEFFDASADRQASIEWDWNTDEDGNRSSRLKIYGIQQLALQDMTRIYENMDFSVAPSTISLGSSSGAGLYISALDGQTHSVTLTRGTLSGTGTATSVFAVSDEFNVSITAVVPGADFVKLSSTPLYEAPNQYHLDYRSGCTLGADYPQINIDFTCHDSGHYFTSDSTYRYWLQFGGVPVYASLSNEPLTTLPRTFTSAYYPTVGYLGQTITTPDATVDTSTPWDYYNNYILPELKVEFPDMEQYFLFPDGYHPGQDPTEPPNPNPPIFAGGIWIGDNYDIDVGITIPTDPNGQPVTDSEGETVTETYIITETRPSDAVYRFAIPTMTPLETQVATIPPYEVPAEYAGYMGDVFSSITTFISDAGLTDVAPVFLALAGLGLVIGVLL